MQTKSLSTQLSLTTNQKKTHTGNVVCKTGAARWSDGTEMVTLDYSHLTSVSWGVCKGFRPSEEAIRNMVDARKRTIKAVYKDSRTGFGSIAQTLRRLRCATPASPKRR